jgi:MFS family permease
LFGGILYQTLGWHSIFWLLAGLGCVLGVVNARWLPETLAPAQVQPFRPGPLLSGYAQLVSNGRFLALTVASGIPFNGMFLYVLSAPVFLGEHLKLAPTQFFWFFICTVAGVMGGAWTSGRLAGRVTPRQQVRWGYRLMMGVALLNVALNLWLPPHPVWAILPVALYAFGWSMMTPVVTLLLLDLVPERRGMASSVQSSLGSAVNGLVAGVLAPLVMHSPLALAVAALALGATGLVGWTWVKRPGRLSTARVGSSGLKWASVHADKRCGDPPMTHLPLPLSLPTLAPLALALAAALCTLPARSSTEHAPAKAEAKPAAKAPAKAADDAHGKPAAETARPTGKTAADPMEVLRERLAEKLGATKAAEAPNAEPAARDGARRVAGAGRVARPHGAPSAAPRKPAPRGAGGGRCTPRRQGGRFAGHAGADGHAAHWAYNGETGPAAWGGLKPEFATCANGKRQSPIDIRGGIAVDLEPVQFDYRASGFTVLDNGHTVQVNLAARATASRSAGAASSWSSSTSTGRPKNASTAASTT